MAVLGLVAIPIVHAAKPVKTPGSTDPLVLDTGFGCAFDVELRPDADAKYTQTEFSDGRIKFTSNAVVTVTNLSNGKSIRLKDRGSLTQEYDAAANDLLIESSGHTFYWFFPGDQTPLGEAGANGALVHVVGHVRETWDLDQDLITSFALDGNATELCSLIA